LRDRVPPDRTQTVLPSGEKKPSCEARPTLVWDTTVLSTVRSTVTVLVKEITQMTGILATLPS